MAQNKAIVKSSGDYLFFLDGDIAPFSHFIQYSLVIAKKGRILSGRRVNLSKKISDKIINNKLKTLDIENNYLSFMIKNANNREARAEQGIQLNPNGFIYKNIILKRVRNTEILGCNFSCYKEDILMINGFDEGYNGWAIISDDTDLTWRFKGLSMELFSSKNIANCFHLWHKIPLSPNIDTSLDIELFKKNKKNKKNICTNGVKKYF